MTAAGQLEFATDAGAPGSDSRRAAISKLMDESAVRTFQSAAVRGLTISESAATATRTIPLALIAVGAFALDLAFGDDLAVSTAIAIIVFVAVDQLFVDRVLEPWLEHRRFISLLNACTEVVELCVSIEEMPHQIAAAYDGVILDSDPPTGRGAARAK